LNSPLTQKICGIILWGEQMSTKSKKSAALAKASYKNVRVNQDLLPLIPHMDDVEGYREELYNLGSQWDLLTILGQMSGTGTDMSATREEFKHLTDELLNQLAQETLKKTVQELGSVAQVAVDILIRNLFERTADIGFLATDDDLRGYIHKVKSGDVSNSESAAIVKRFKEYVAKYSVYHNIILMDTEGNVLTQLDGDNPVDKSNDPLIAEAMNTSEEFVEVFGHSDLEPEKNQSLIYAYRVTETNEEGSPLLGVLCLCFRFENEMEGIFGNLLDEGDWRVISILDKQGKVIASSDPYQLPVGASVEQVKSKSHKIVRFAGRNYLAKTCATKGYQGFYGLGWQGHVMLPLEQAFRSDAAGADMSQMNEALLEMVMNDPHMFSEELREIPVQADAILKNLNRTVWNGNVRQTTTESRVLLRNISAAGERTKEVFESSIGNLHETVVSAILEDVEFQAALAVDIMDRNLYERANDCRWWALTSEFRRILAQDVVSEQDAKRVGEILKYINDLYTVYTNLIVYDAEGKVIAVSNSEDQKLVGQTLRELWVKETLELTSSQSYTVSPFEKSSLYHDKDTYVYGAAITDLQDSDRVVGGIAIVFDSTPQFQSMLEDSLPRDHAGKVAEGFFAVFCDRDRRVISCSSGECEPGTELDLGEEFFRGENGSGVSRIVQVGDTIYAAGSLISAGYREYKVKDEYRNDVVAIVFAPLATALDNAETEEEVEIKRPDLHFDVHNGEEAIETATFLVGDRTFAFRNENIVKAVGINGLTEIPGSHEQLLGKLRLDDHAIPVVSLQGLINHNFDVNTSECQVVVVKSGADQIGIVVDELGEITSIPKTALDLNASLLDAADKYTEGVMMPKDCESYTEMVVLLDVERLVGHLASMGTFKTETTAEFV